MIGTPATDLHSPGSIGDVTPGPIAATTLAASGSVSGAGITALFASPLQIGNVARNYGNFINISLDLNEGVNFPGSTIKGKTGGIIELDGSRIDCLGPIKFKTYTVGTLPDVATYAQAGIYVSDGTGNKRFAISDGTNWRFPDGNIVS